MNITAASQKKDWQMLKRIIPFKVTAMAYFGKGTLCGNRGN